MKFGMPTLVELDTLEQHAKLASELSLQFIEINMSFPQYTAGALDIELLNQLSERYGVFYTIHADEFLNPFDFNPKVSTSYFDIMRDTISVARSIGAKIINLHLQKGIYVTLPERVILLTDVYEALYLDTVKRFIAMCEEEIADSGIRIAIENVDTNAFTVSQLKAIDMFMKSDAFALTLDTGHEFALGFCDAHVYAKYPEKLLHMHLHDCIGKKPHQALGDGDVNISDKVALLRGETCLIEVKTVDGLLKSVEYIKRVKL